MNAVNFLKGLFRARDEPEKTPLDTGKDGEMLFKDDIIARIKEEAEKRRAERAAIERQWTLNSNFLMGNQWCAINTYHQNEIEEIPKLSEYEQRETFNRIAPLYSTRCANLAKLSYDMVVKPATSELDDYYKSEVSTAILKSAKRVTDFDHLSEIGLSWAEITGNSFYYTFWDKNAGDELARAEITEIDADEVKKKVDIIREGEVATFLLSPYEVFPESLFKQGIENQRSIIIEQVASVNEVKDVYGIDVEGGSVQVFDISPSPVTGGLGYISTVQSISTHTVDDSVKVITYFERPSGRHPDGLMAVVVGDELAFYGNLPFGEIPVVQQVCIPIAGQFFGKSWIEDCIPAQRAYNGIVNKIHDYIRTTAVNNPLIQAGSIEDIEDLEENGVPPGVPLVYKRGYEPPSMLVNGSLPSELTNEIYRLQSEMEYSAGLSHLQLYGDSQNSVTAASAIAQLREVDDTRLSRTAESIRMSVRDIAKMWLKLYKKHAKLYRVIKSVGVNIFGDAIVWCGEDISDNDIEFATENELMNSPEKQQERFIQAWNMGLFADGSGVVPESVKRRAIELMKTGNWADGLTINDLQTSRAERENNLFENGSTPEIGEFDDHDIHAEVHEKYILQARFELLKQKKPEYAEMMLAHLKQHKEIIRQREQENLQAAMIASPQ